jgi:hypothetical protein
MIMNKTPLLFWFLITCIFLSACNAQIGQPLALPSDTPKPSATMAATQTAVSPTLTSKPAETSTGTPTPYPLKQVLLDYTIGGYHTPYEIYYADYGADGWSALVLYSDGQLIIPGTTYQQKILSKEEIQQLFLQLENKGYYLLKQETLYDFGNQEPPRVYDGTTYCISTTGEREQNLCAYEPHKSFLDPQMMDILQFIDQYRPQGMTPYSPDRILLWVQAGRSPYVENLPTKAISWPANLSSLETPDEKFMYFQGEEAREVYALFGHEISTVVMSQNGKEYTVSIDIVLPHEELRLP